MNTEIIDDTFAKRQPQQDLDGAGGILTMGILSIVFCGLIGLILASIALTRAKSARELYREYPGQYTESSYNKVNAGRICAIVGISLLGLVILIAIGLNAG